jgi:hypothetical protein
VPEALHQRALMRARHPGLLEQAVRELEVRLIREELARNSGQRYAAAKRLGISYNRLIGRLRDAGDVPPDGQIPDGTQIMCPRKNSMLAIGRCQEYQRELSCTCDVFRLLQIDVDPRRRQAIKVGAYRLGMSARDYKRHIVKGEQWCRVHRRWFPEANFYPSRYRGHTRRRSICIECTLESGKLYKQRKREARQ